VKERFIIRSIQIGLIMFVAAIPLALGVQSAMAENEDKAEAKVVFTGEQHQNILLFKVIAAGGTMALSVLAAAYAVGKVGAAAMGAASEKPEVLNRALVFVALGEGLAILGLVVALMIIGAKPMG
jgi:F0F1-type ATP synthase membrane subunit c/vacuolar-type H+-ATPase subunit K